MVIVFITVDHLKSLGTVKSQTIKYELLEKYTFEARKEL